MMFQLLLAMDVTPIPTAHPSWIELGTALAVLLSAMIQKLDSIRVKRTLAYETARQAELTHIRNKKLDEIHSLVNGTMLDQKKITMVFAKRIAELTNNDSDKVIAQEAEREYIEHQMVILKRSKEGNA